MHLLDEPPHDVPRLRLTNAPALGEARGSGGRAEVVDQVACVGGGANLQEITQTGCICLACGGAERPEVVQDHHGLAALQLGQAIVDGEAGREAQAASGC